MNGSVRNTESANSVRLRWTLLILILFPGIIVSGCAGCFEDLPPASVHLNFPDNATSYSLDLSWDVSYEDDFYVYRLYWETEAEFDTSNAEFLEVDSLDQTHITVQELTPGTEYFFQLFVLDEGDQASESSNETFGSTLPLNPAVQINQPGYLEPDIVRLTWERLVADSIDAFLMYDGNKAEFDTIGLSPLINIHPDSIGINITLPDDEIHYYRIYGSLDSKVFTGASNEVAVRTTSWTNELTGTVGVQGQIALSGDDLILMSTHPELDQVSVFSTSDMSETLTFSVDGYPWAIESNKDGSLAYVGSAERGSVSVIRTVDGVIIQSFEIGRNLADIAYNFSANQILATSPLDSVYTVIDLTSEELIVTQAGTIPGEVCAFEDQPGFIVSLPALGELLVIDYEEPGTVQTISLGGNPGRVTISNDSKSCWVSLPSEGAVFQVLLSDGSIIDSLYPGGQVSDFTISDDALFYTVTLGDIGETRIISKNLGNIFAVVNEGSRPYTICKSVAEDKTYISQTGSTNISVLTRSW